MSNLLQNTESLKSLLSASGLKELQNIDFEETACRLDGMLSVCRTALYYMSNSGGNDPYRCDEMDVMRVLDLAKEMIPYGAFEALDKIKEKL